MCLDIASSLLAEKWLWERHREMQGDVVDEMGSELPEQADVDKLICMLISRCSDVAATVRSRAVGALWDLINSISNPAQTKGTKCMQTELSQRLYSLIMGREEVSTNNKSIMNTLRELVCDEKALVRTKAIQAVGGSLVFCYPPHNISTYSIYVGLIYSMEWPSSSLHGGEDKTSLMFLSEEHIVVLADR